MTLFDFDTYCNAERDAPFEGALHHKALSMSTKLKVASPTHRESRYQDQLGAFCKAAKLHPEKFAI